MSTRMHSSYYRSPKTVSSSLAGEFLHHSVPPVYPTIAPPSFPCRPGSSIQIDCRLEGSSTKTCVRRETGKESCKGGRCRVTMDMLPDVALLEIFDFYMNQAREEDADWPPTEIEAWHTLVHVCRTWRTIVLGSPHRLDLRLFCTDKTPVKETLAVWPPLPIVIMQVGQPTQMDNIILALEHNDRVCQIDLMHVINPELEEFLAAMQQPFPALTELALWYGYRPEDEDEINEMPVIPESFLGGSAARLQRLELGTSSFRIHFTRGNGPLSHPVDEARTPFDRIQIPSISPCPGNPTSASAHTFDPPYSHLFPV
ncbi:hypothetical protein V8E52_007799 [Russula decolorans]